MPETAPELTGEKHGGATDTAAPDGGLAAWSVVLGAWCILFCSFGWINSSCSPGNSTLSKNRGLTCASAGIGAFQNYYQEDLLKQYSPSTIAWIPSLQIFFMYAMVR